MESLIRPDLWELLLPVIKTARSAGLKEIESGRYVSRYRVTEVQESTTEWPITLKTPYYLSGKEDPVDWKLVYTTKSDSRIGISLTEIPELREAFDNIVQKCLQDPELYLVISLMGLIPDLRSDQARDYAERGLLDLIGTIINRCDAMATFLDADIKEFYLQLERGRLLSEVSGDLVIPIVLTNFELDGPVEIDEGCWIEPISDDFQRARALDWSRHDRISPFVAAAATHAFVMRQVKVRNDAWGARGLRGDHDVDLSDADLFVDAVVAITGRGSGYAQVLMRPDNWATDFDHDLPPIWKISVVENYPIEFENGRWNDPMNPISSNDIADIARAFVALRKGRSNMQIAARRHRRATLRQDPEDEILDAVIGIESLLGTQGSELVHRISLRAAVVLSDQISPHDTYNLIKKIYEQRSAIVHGMRPKSDSVKVGADTHKSKDVAGFVLQLLLKSCLLDDEPWTPATLDDRILQSLASPTNSGL